ncbi:MAG: relaxase domain-containing protein [Ilumatobacteraceae bacterium]
MANGLEEYYTGAGEAPGVWVGTRVESLGLVGEVEPAHLRAVRAGLTPRTGLTPDGTTLHAHPRQVPGFDLMFSVPKSVSVAYALANRRVQHLIVTACEATLAETLGWLEREACFVRRRTNKPAERARFCDAVGISGTYEPQVNRLILTTHPVAHRFVSEDRSAGSRTGHWRLTAFS